jgi:hypothetical protein
LLHFNGDGISGCTSALLIKPNVFKLSGLGRQRQQEMAGSGQCAQDEVKITVTTFQGPR